MTEGLGTGITWLLREIRCGVLSSLTFTDKSIIRYFDQPRLGKPVYIVEGKRGNVD